MKRENPKFPPFLKSSADISKNVKPFISTVTVTVTNGRKKLPVVDWIAKPVFALTCAQRLTTVPAPACGVLSVEAVLSEEGVHPKAGKMRIAGNPVKLSESKFKVRNPAPTLGQDNDEVFRQCLGISAQEMEELKQEGVI